MKLKISQTTLGVWKNLSATLESQLELIARVNNLVSGFISEDARLAVILPFSFNKEDFDPEEWEDWMKSVNWIKLNLFISGDNAHYLLNNSNFIPGLIDEFYFSTQLTQPDIYANQLWKYSLVIQREFLSNLNTQKIVDFTFFLD